MTNDSTDAGEVRVLRTETELSAYLHRTRMAILNALRAGPSTTSQVAVRLGVHPANLTRHMRTLSTAGLIVLAETRDTGKNLEKYYARVAERYVVEPDISGLTAPHRIALTFAQSQLAVALARLPDHMEMPVAALTLTVRLAPDRARQFAEELGRLAQRFGTDDESGHPYEAVLALFPGEEEPPGPLAETGTVRLSRDGGEQA